MLKITNRKYHTHLKGNRGLSSLFLDWREICDRKCGCIDDCIGSKDCFQLGINACPNDRVRCRYGICVQKIYFVILITLLIALKGPVKCMISLNFTTQFV